MIFFACIVSVFVSDLFSSAFEGFHYLGDFGSFEDSATVLYEVRYAVGMNILILVPTALIGLACGGLGAVFTFINIKVGCKRQWTAVAPNANASNPLSPPRT